MMSTEMFRGLNALPHPRSSWVLVAVALLLGTPSAFAQSAAERTWQGTVKVGDRTLDVRLTVQRDGDGAKARLDLMEARLPDFPLPRFSIGAARVTFEVPPGWGLAMFRDIGLKPEDQRIAFEGEISDGGQVTGTLTLAHASFPLTLSRPPRSNDDKPYRSEDVEFKNGEVVISGSLLLPKTPTPSPAVVLVAGSGGRTRNAHELEASVLAAHGVAALVYDKRGAGRSSGANLNYATVEELTTDVQAAIAYLRS